MLGGGEVTAEALVEGTPARDTGEGAGTGVALGAMVGSGVGTAVMAAAGVDAGVLAAVGAEADCEIAVDAHPTDTAAAAITTAAQEKRVVLNRPFTALSPQGCCARERYTRRTRSDREPASTSRTFASVLDCRRFLSA